VYVMGPTIRICLRIGEYMEKPSMACFKVARLTLLNLGSKTDLALPGRGLTIWNYTML